IMESQGCLNLTRYFLFLFNLIFFILGAILLAFGVWILFDKSSFISTLGTPNLALKLCSYGLSGVGIFTMMMGFLGCLGALQQTKWLLGCYFVCLFLLFGAQVVVGVLIYTQRSSLREFVSTYVNELITNYNTEDGYEAREETWDFVQIQFQCCGWKSPVDWEKNEVLKANGTQMHPCSCLSKNQTLLEANQTASSVTRPTITKGFCVVPEVTPKGCVNEVQDWLTENIYGILLVSLVVGLVELIFVVVVLFYIRNLKNLSSALPRSK
uniref:Tetraspanin n=1 Tax=Latimeria chalumnae TaxID=7897 RepID=H3AGV6_LATCH